ncbi:GFA family protein [Pelagibius sp.]|uniref:GFA family protein n=1 Tax=Pelagibius sp. TaxID=1931238 RepID=UPI0026034E61|nr:GFA family protein [Pelagibius sp.]
MTERIETGACFCGAIAAELRGEPFWICYDHDDDCRRAIGSPLTIWIGVRPSQFRILRGNPKSFSKTPGVLRSFCGDCGTSIGYRDEGIADELYLSIGFFDRPEAFRPQAHAYWRQKLPWLAFADPLPRIDGYSRDRDPAFGYPADRDCG